MKLKLFVFSVLLYIVIVTIEAKRSGGGSRTSSRSPSRSRPSPSRTHKTIPSVIRPLPKPSIPKKQQDKFLDAERKLSTSNLKPLNSDGVKPSIGLEHLTPGKYSPSAPPLPVSSNQQNPPSATSLPRSQFPSYSQPNMNPLHKPSAPPLPGSLNQHHVGNQYPSYQNPGQQSPFNTDTQHNQYLQSAPSVPSYPNQPNFGNQYHSQKNPGQGNLGNLYPSYPNPGQGNLGNQYPSYPNPGQDNLGNQYPSYPNPGQGNLGSQYPSYLNPSQPNIVNQYPGYAFPRQAYPPSYYPNQHSSGNQYPSYQNYPHSNLGYSSQPNQNPFGNYYSQPTYQSTGYFVTANNGMYNQGSHYSRYPGYTGMYGNNYGSSNRRSFIPIPIPIPIPMSFPTSWTSNDYDSQLRHILLNRMLKKIEETNKNQTSLFVINNSTLTPCNKEEFTYGGVVNLTITTCTVLNCTAVSMVTSFNKSGEIIRNNGMITMCLYENTTVSTNYSGTAQPKVSEVNNYWKWKCANVPLLNQTLSFSNGTRIGQNTTFCFINNTYIGQNLTNFGLNNGTNIVQNVTKISVTNVGRNSTRIDLSNGPHYRHNVSRVVLTNGTNFEQNADEHQIDSRISGQNISHVELTNSTNTEQNADGHDRVLTSFVRKEEPLDLLNVDEHQIDGRIFGQNISHVELTNSTNTEQNADGHDRVLTSFVRKEEPLDLLNVVNSTNHGKNISSNVENGTSVDHSDLQVAKTTMLLTNEKNSSYSDSYGKSTLKNSTHLENVLQPDKSNNLTIPRNSSQICGIENCSTTVFCMPTIEDTCTDALNTTCKQKMTSYKSCTRIKMCKSDIRGIDRSVTLNTTIADYYPETNNLTERWELANLTVITYFAPVLPTVGNFTTMNATSTNTVTNVTLPTPLQARAGFVSLNVTGNSTVPLDSIRQDTVRL